MSFAPDELSRDAFAGGRLTLLQPLKGYRAATDPVFLAAYVRARPGERILDLGCGVGTAALCLGRRIQGLELHGLELQPEYADLARRNADANGIAVKVHVGHLLAPPADLKALQFDQVIANPPYFAGHSATASPNRGRDTANRERESVLGDWISFGLRRLRPRGRITFIQKADRLQDLLVGLSGRTGAIEILPLAPRPGRPAGRVLVRAVKGSSGPMTLLAPLTVHKGTSHVSDHSDYTDEAMKVLRELSGLLPDTRYGGIST